MAMSQQGEYAGMEIGAVALWCAYPGDLQAEEVLRECAALLDEAERARAGRFRFERHAGAYIASQALARIALSHEHPLLPAAWRLSANAYGKPSAEPECGLRFNLSNCDELVVCLVARGAEVGVDTEPWGRANEIAALAPEVFSRREQEQLAALPEAERPDRALSLWTLKEAYIKARGRGLSLPLGQFSFVFGGAEGIRLKAEPDVDEEPGRWRFCLLDHAEHRIALMVEQALRSPALSAQDAERMARPALQMWEARPLTGAPMRLHGVKTAGWF
jgi:4'-phosphopantetheinyl transferase